MNYLQRVPVTQMIEIYAGTRENNQMYHHRQPVFSDALFFRSRSDSQYPHGWNAASIGPGQGLGLALFFSWTAAALTFWLSLGSRFICPRWKSVLVLFAVAVLGIPFIFFAVRETANMPMIRLPLSFISRNHNSLNQFQFKTTLMIILKKYPYKHLDI